MSNRLISTETQEKAYTEESMQKALDIEKESFMEIIVTIFFVFFVVMICGCCLIGCLEDGSTTQEKTYTEESIHNALDAVGLPDIVNFYERHQLKSIYELRDDPELICYWYTKNQLTGKWVFEGTCMVQV